jgi:mannose-6-phosphate isomerase-like protein (cupin superfamily)
MKLIAVAAALALALPAIAQIEKKAEVFTSHDIHAELDALGAKAQASGSGGTTLGDYGSHKLMLSVRTTSGGAEVHAHFDDVMIVTQGSATLITGGTVVDAKTGPDGETKGKSISGGNTQTITAGDIVHVPAGVPHQLLVPAGTTYSSIVIKVRE